jgi:DNA repair protein RecN (Recombination protein N)
VLGVSREVCQPGLLWSDNLRVAAKGDHHFKVEKSEQNGKFKTQLHLLNPETRINEIAKMLSKNEITDTAIAHARELMN